MRKLKILLVDDEKDFREIMKVRILSWDSVEHVLTARDGKRGIDAVKKEKPDLVILDYMMPGIDGVKTLKRIRNFNKDVPVIMFTAYPNEKSMKLSEKLNVFAFIPKWSEYTDVEKSLKVAVDSIVRKIDN
ncbi:MAG: response regulator [Candidatus Omnitrophica bacterium]|nr:response regulator [Candidatus Omnitrophota bacterium]MCF7877267.1 response regulator [Candidatus Omnitrophota bacterium]MCF7878665.1 response regulator [Candidatus Omnitrophota bacterium]MCF7893367.1 response regulator [Candidatus Omnitrophota bacterium]